MRMTGRQKARLCRHRNNMPADTMLFLLIAAGVLIVLSMIFSASESAFLSISKLRVRFLRERKNRRAERTGRLLDNNERLINTLLVANTIVNIALSAVLTTVSVGLFGTAGVGIATAVVTVLLLIFGEITPKTIASRHPEPFAFTFAFLITVLEKLLAPLVAFFSLITRLTLRLCGVQVSRPKVSFTEEEIKTFIDVGQETGVLETSEKNMMRSVFRFTDLDARKIMVPRRNITAISDKTTYSEVIRLARRTKLSRFPVYTDDIDHIIGVLYLKDLLLKDADDKNFSVRSAMRPPLFILETKRMTSIQQMLRENRQSLAIVLDEYSGTYGILTSEDIQREIFGVITSDYDDDAEKVPAESVPDAREIAGSARLIDLAEELHVHFASGGSETIGGYMAERLDRIPEAGDRIAVDGFAFTVKAMDKMRVASIIVEPQRV